MTLSPDAMKLRAYSESLAAAAERLQGMGKGGVSGHLVATLVPTEPTRRRSMATGWQRLRNDAGGTIHRNRRHCARET